MINTIILGTRGSPLALIQTKSVISRMKQCFPEIELKIKIIKTDGDKDQNTSLKLTEHLGLFASEIQNALIKNEIDVAVHSLKDLPVASDNKLKIGAIPERVIPSDLLYHPKGLSIQELPHGATVGTCSLRRAGQLKYLRKDLIIKDIRGNIENRMKKVDKGEYDSTVLASAGLIRLKYDISNLYTFSLDELIPAPGQGAIALEIREEDYELEKVLSKIDNPKKRNSIEIERGVLDKMGGGCSFPLGVVSFFDKEIDTFACLVDPTNGHKIVVKELNWKGTNIELIDKLSEKLINNGGGDLISKINKK
jgi:hydroxymethylbilane synthase